jgi:DNA primase
MNTYKHINIKPILNILNIPYTESGKNTAAGWVNVRCPFCFDHSNHCGINIQTGNGFHCWICGESGSTFKFLKQETSFSGAVLFNLIKENSSQDSPNPKEFKSFKNSGKIKFPTGLTPYLEEPHKNYLRKRNLNPEELEKNYNLQSTYAAGSLPYRIIIPIEIDGQVVSYSSRDITGRQEEKYKHASNENVLIPVKQTLYGLKQLGGKTSCILVEGVFDMWRIGIGALAIFGTLLSEEQILLLLKTYVNKVYVCLDADAKRKAETIAYTLTPFFPEVNLISIDYKDPDSMPIEEVKQLQQLIR